MAWGELFAGSKSVGQNGRDIRNAGGTDCRKKHLAWRALSWRRCLRSSESRAGIQPGGISSAAREDLSTPVRATLPNRGARVGATAGAQDLPAPAELEDTESSHEIAHGAILDLNAGRGSEPRRRRMSRPQKYSSWPICQCRLLTKQSPQKLSCRIDSRPASGSRLRWVRVWV